MKRTILYGALVFLALPFLAEAGSGDEFRVYPLPLLETEKILSRWLGESGYHLSRSASETGTIHITAVYKEETWRMVLMPRSPLSSAVRVEYAMEGRPSSKKIEEVWAFLDEYSGRISPSLPSFLAEEGDSVACIKANSGLMDVQFSGFFIDPYGVILSTAHDLESVRGIKVILPGGREARAKIVKRDANRDLALIKIESPSPSSINLKTGRKLAKEEKIYAVCRTPQGDKKILSGLVSPLRVRSNHLPLWQAEMEAPPGCSGSPVFDGRGNFFSILKGRHRENHSVGFLIPLETILDFLNEK